MKARVLLASCSPRRRELLERIGVAHDTVDVDIEEAPTDGEHPRRYVERLALAKARAGRAAAPGPVERGVRPDGKDRGFLSWR